MSVETQKSAATPRREQAVTPARENAAVVAVAEQLGTDMLVVLGPQDEPLGIVLGPQAVGPQMNMQNVIDTARQAVHFVRADTDSFKGVQAKTERRQQTLSEAVAEYDGFSGPLILGGIKKDVEQGKAILVDGPETPGYVEKALSAEIVSCTLAEITGRDQKELLFLKDIDMYVRDDFPFGGEVRAGAAGGTHSGIKERFFIEVNKDYLKPLVIDYHLDEIYIIVDKIVALRDEQLDKLAHGMRVLSEQGAYRKRRFTTAHEMLHYAKKRYLLSSSDNINLVQSMLERMTRWKEWESQDEQASLDYFGYQDWESALKEMGVAVVNTGAMLGLHIFKRQAESGILLMAGSIVVGKGLEELLTKYLEQLCAVVYEQLDEQGVVDQLSQYLKESSEEIPSVSDLLAQKGRSMSELVEQAVLQQEVPLVVQILLDKCGSLSRVVEKLYFDPYGFYELMCSFESGKGFPDSFLFFLLHCDTYEEALTKDQLEARDFRYFGTLHDAMKKDYLHSSQQKLEANS